MAATGRILKDTVVGGLLFLVPVALLGLVLGKALKAVGRAAEPIAQRFPSNAVAGVALSTVIAVVFLLLACFAAGAFARTLWGRRTTAWFEESLLGGLPQYRMVKSLAEGLTQVQAAGGLRVALASVEDAWQLAYVMEQLDNGWSVVFLPQAPTPMSGNVMYLPPDRVRPLDMTVAQAMQLVKKLGIGSREALRGTSLESTPRA
jgi:uncharacterized membrane protein